MSFKKIRQYLSLALALLLAINFSPLSVKADIAKDTGMIHVTGAESGVAVQAYRLLDVIYDYEGNQPVEPMFCWTAEMAPWIQIHYPDYITEGNAVTETYSRISDNDAAVFYDDVAAAIRNGNPAVTAASTAVSDSKGAASLKNLTMGNYLVLIENGFNVYRPSAVNLIPVWDDQAETWKMTEAHVELKSSKPSIVKKVTEGEETDRDSVSAGIGETVEFTLTAEVPVFPAQSLAEKFVISDTLPEELTLNSESIQVTGITAAGQRTVLDQGAYSKTEVRPSDLKPASFVLDFDYAKISQYSRIEVVYSATVNSKAVTGSAIINKAHLDYSNNPYDSDSVQKMEDETEIYTYGIELLKHKKGDEGTVLSGARFNLSASEDNSDPVALVKVSEGVYRVADANDVNAVTVMETNAQGKITVTGLDEGVWYLTEIKAPNGYVRLSTPVTVTITADRENTDLNGGVVIGNEQVNEDGIVRVKVENREGFTLPHTGGMGTVVFTAGGILLIAAGVVLFLRSFRKNRA